ncbi:MAG: DUF4010 domain-containing protein [Myxococcales bacterium]|nr:DUF4010 domain-containing protein [Myxococcales bacterium]
MDTAPLVEALYAIGIGLVVGLEREHSEVADGLAAGDIPAEHQGRAIAQPAAGVRTLALLSLTGWLLAYLSDRMVWILPIGMIAVAAVVAAQVIVSRGSGMTTEVAALVVLLLGAVVHVDRPLAIALCLGTAMLLVSKPWMHGFVAKVRRIEITATLQLLLLVAIVLPLLPTEAQDPWGALPPRKVGTFIVLIAGVQYVGYVLTRWLGADRGAGLAGLVGGLTSSTAVTVSMARAARATPELTVPNQLATFLANTVMPIRVAVIAWAIDREVGWRVALALAAMALTLLIAALVTWRQARQQAATERAAIELKNPFELWGAIGWGAILCGVLLAAHFATEWFGHLGLYVAAAISGITDVDAITLAAADGGKAGTIAPAWAALAITIAAVSNTIAKGLMAYFGGGRGFGRRIALVFAIAVVVTVATALASVVLT